MKPYDAVVDVDREGGYRILGGDLDRVRVERDEAVPALVGVRERGRFACGRSDPRRTGRRSGRGQGAREVFCCLAAHFGGGCFLICTQLQRPLPEIGIPFRGHRVCREIAR